MPHDFIVVGAGSAGCAVAWQLARLQAGSVLVIEAGPSDLWPLVRMPFGLVAMMGSMRRDWRFRSAPQPNADNRSIGIPRGRMLGGSGSINSMVWFRGTAGDFDAWDQPGWAWADVEPAFEAVEAHLTPARYDHAHPLTRGLQGIFGNDPDAAPSPDRESGGVFRFNMRNGRRWSAADAFLWPAQALGVQVLQNTQIARLTFAGDRASGVVLEDGTHIPATKGVILSAGSIGSPDILLRSGIGPADDLRAAGVDVVRDASEVGANLHDHPGCGLFFTGPGSGYGLSREYALDWLLAPANWMLRGRGILASPTVEGGMFFNAHGTDAQPDIQSHFIPFYMNPKGGKTSLGQGYFADAVVCQPKSRGHLRRTKTGLEIDLGLFRDPADLDLLVAGITRLRTLLDAADFGPRRAPEVHPGADVTEPDALRAHIRANAGTAYHPVGTLGMGRAVTAQLKLKDMDGLWVADASVMPRITSANTNAPSMMIGYRAGVMIAEDAA